MTKPTLFPHEHHCHCQTCHVSPKEPLSEWMKVKDEVKRFNGKVDGVKQDFEKIKQDTLSIKEKADTIEFINAEEVNKEISSLTEQLADIAVFSSSFGAVGDGVSDDLQAIKNAIAYAQNNGKSTVMLPNTSKGVFLSDTLTIPKGITLKGNNFTKIKSGVVGKPIIFQKKTSSVEDIEFDLLTSEALCAIEMDNLYEPMTWSTGCYGRKLKFNGGQDSGRRVTHGLYCKAIKNGDRLFFSYYEDLYFQGVKHGIHLETLDGVNGFLNANQFNNIRYASQFDRLVYFKNVGGNIVTGIEYNSSGTEIEMVYIEGDSNRIEGMFYDVGMYGSDMLCTIKKGQWNYISHPASIVRTYMNTKRASIERFSTQLFDDSPSDFSTYYNLLMQRQSSSKSINLGSYGDLLGEQVYDFYKGEQDNFLSYADKIYNISVTGTWLSGLPAYMFDPTDGKNYSFKLKTTETGVIEINFPQTINLFDYASIGFREQYKPTRVIIEYKDTSDNWFVLADMSNLKTAVATYYAPANQPKSIKGLRYTVYGNASEIVEVVNVSAKNQQNIGTTFLPINGGKIYGNVDLNKNKLINLVLDQGVTSNRPTQPTKGQLFYDTTLNKPIWFNGSSWTDSNGTTV